MATKPLICGHRGASGRAPENTLAAFHKGQELGADWVELDVQLSADGHLVVFHDDTLARTTGKGGNRRPSDLTLEQLKKLDAGSWFAPEFAGERIPTLEEVLDEFGGKVSINIEIKSTPGFEPDNGIEAKVVEAVVKRNLFDSTMVSSFDLARLVAVHQIEPRMQIGALYTAKTLAKFVPEHDPFKLATITAATALHPHFQLVNPNLIARAHSANLQVNIWTVNEPTDMRRLAEWGVDMIMTDYPDTLKAVLS